MILLDTDLVSFTINVLQFLLPAVIVFFVAYYILNRFLEEDYRKKLLEYKNSQSQIMVPAKLQAYERLTILLDRLSPENLILRLANPKESATVFRQRLISNIHEEFNHNISQQIYVSDQAWKLIRSVKDQLLLVIDSAYKDMKEDSKGTDLGRQILEDMMHRKENPTQIAIAFLKKEIELLL